ncbi:unnamed protein product, partial [Polarella glacialis]
AEYAGSFYNLTDTIKKKRCALQAVQILLRFPHAYEALFEMGFLRLLVSEVSEGLEDLRDQASEFSSLTNRLTSRAQRTDSWRNKRLAAFSSYRLLCTTAHLLSPIEAPDYVDEFSRVRVNILGGTGDQNEIIMILQDATDTISADIKKFTQALSRYVDGETVQPSMTSKQDAVVILNILRTLCYTVGKEEYPARFAESERLAHRLKSHSASTMYECSIPGAASLVVTFDSIPIGAGAVEIFQNGVKVGSYNRFIVESSDKAMRALKFIVRSDKFEWCFKYQAFEVDENDDSAGSENKGYRFMVRPIFDTDHMPTIQMRRKEVLEKPGFIRLLTSLHSSVNGVGKGGERVQNDVDLKVVEMLSFLAQRNGEPPHRSITSEFPDVEKNVFQIMFDILERRPTLVDQSGLNGQRRKMLDDFHISVARFYHGISMSEEGRQHFSNHQEALMRIVDIASDNTRGQDKQELQPPPDTCLCYDGSYIIHCLTNFSNKPSRWTPPQSLNLLRPQEPAKGLLCEFGRGELVWSASLHVFLMDEHYGDLPAVFFYKGTSPSSIQSGSERDLWPSGLWQRSVCVVKASPT